MKRLFSLVNICLFFLYPVTYSTQISFLPSDITNLKTWLKSTDGITISSGQISNWTDQTSNQTNFQQLNSSMQPVVSLSNTLNNLPSIYFDGQDQLLSDVNFSFSDATIFLVASQKNIDNAYGRFLDHDYQNGFWIGRDANNNSIGGGFFEVNSPFGNFNLTKNDTAFIYSLIRHDDTVYSVINHNFFSTPYRITSNGVTQSNPISLGASIVGTFFGNKNIYEIIIYNRHLTQNERQQVESYLNDKYSPPVELVDTITTCTFPITINVKKDYFVSYQWQDLTTADSLVVNTPGTYYVSVTDIFGRITSDTVIVNLDNTSTAVNLPPDTAICIGNTLTIHAGEPYFTYLWSNSAISNEIVVSTSGIYKVTMTDCLGNVSSDSIHVYVHALPSFELGNDTIICSNIFFELSPNLTQLVNCSFKWQDNSTDSVLQITSSGLYSLIATDEIGCNFKDSISILVDASLIGCSLGPDTNLCAGNSIALITPTASVSSYSWSTGATTSAITVTNTGQYSVVVTNTNNCVAKDTIQVNIIGQAPTADFNNTVSCKNQSVNFNDNSSPPSTNTITSWYWNYGDNSTLADTSHLQNSFYTYADTGVYSVSLIVETNVGCKQQFIKTIHVAPVPTASFAIPAVACQNDSVLFLNQSSNLPGYNMSAYNWNFGDLGTSSAVSPKHLYSNNQNYTVKLLTTNNAGCKDSIYKVVSVKAEVKADFTTLKACTNSPTLFQSTSTAPSGATYLWNFGNSFSNIANPSKLYTNSGVYSVKLDVDGGNGCTSSITKLINVYLPPLVSFSANAFCAKDTIQISNLSIAQSGVISSSNWRLNGTTFSALQSPTLSINSPATYTVLLSTINSFGCADSASQTLNVYTLPNIDVITNPASYYYIDAPVTFSTTINNANSYNWNIPSVMTSTLSSPVTTFTLPGTYTVMLYLIDENGCEGSKTKLMNVAKRYLDLAVMSVKTSKDNAGFISVIADLANYGSVPVTTFDIHYQTNDAGNNKETWNGSINPNSFYTYTFTAKSASKLSDQNNITCVHIESVNTIHDENLLNNDLCNSLNYDNISVENPLPNPTDGDITLPIILTKDMEFTMAIYNAMGQIQMPETTYNGLQGLNFITLPTSSLARGSYIIKVMINDKVFIKKFIRINN